MIAAIYKLVSSKAIFTRVGTLLKEVSEGKYCIKLPFHPSASFQMASSKIPSKVMGSFSLNAKAFC